MQVGGEGNLRLEGKNGKATVQLLVNPKQYISVVAEQYQTVKQHYMHMTSWNL
jgi:hypothetical protein